MKNIQKRSFDVYAPGSKTQKPQLLETIDVEVETRTGQEFLTQESRQRIENIRARHMGLMTGEDIKTLRARLNLSQSDLTELLQCGEKSLSRWENGHGFPIGTANVLLRLLDEGFLAPISLMAVQGPRHSHPWLEDLPDSSSARKKPLLYLTETCIASSAADEACDEFVNLISV